VDDGKVLVVVVSTDKGMCGSINTNLNRYVKQLPGARDMNFVLIGEKSIPLLFYFCFCYVESVD
jgi:F0F1-type ATP synthase gamma subunit